jgi:hypothetical protein
MTKKEAIKKAMDKQRLNKARKIYLQLRAVNRLVDELQKRFSLFPVLEEIDIKEKL